MHAQHGRVRLPRLQRYARAHASAPVAQRERGNDAPPTHPTLTHTLTPRITPLATAAGGFTEGAYEYLKSAPGLANAFYIPYGQSLTESSQTLACPSEKVNAISGALEQLQGGFAQVKGYHYAVPPCTSGGCEKQDLKKLQSALEHTPVSVCVNAASWNDYVGGVLTSAACGPMAADAQDHCVMATGFNATAPTPYLIVRNSWASTFGENGYIYLEMAKNTCGVADDGAPRGRRT